ncbi:MAG TPA: IS110 family transposase [Jatrophihabitantaceae bacterium]|nr:IS110 family transposase [Jatrophihabitantaceae bacterium]
MREPTTFVGMDVHKKDIAVTMLVAGRADAVEWRLANEPTAVRRLARRLVRDGEGLVHCVYEAGPCGYALQRQLEAEGLECDVVAPSMIPIRPGERVKTDRRDARKLAEMARARLLTVVRPPSEDEEAVRDLCRGRDDARVDLMRARHRLSKFLLRRGRVFGAGQQRAWSQAHRWWLGAQSFERVAEQVMFQDYLLAVEQIEARKRSIDVHLQDIAREPRYAEAVGWLRCFRGIDTVTAITLVAELHDFRRFRSPSQLMAYLGLVPSEYSSGPRQQRGGITRTGNRHVRRLLIEAAWHYRHKPRVGEALAERRHGQPAVMIALADKAQLRLCRRYRRMERRGKHTTKIVVAVARELVGYLWAALTPATAVSAK